MTSFEKSLAQKQDQKLQRRLQDELKRLRKQGSNLTCADCGDGDTRFASANLGVFLCNRCFGVHRGVGQHVTKPKVLTLDNWTEGEVARLAAVGNTAANAFYLARLPPGIRVPTPDTRNDEVSRFARQKYEERRFSAEGAPPWENAARDTSGELGGGACGSGAGARAGQRKRQEPQRAAAPDWGPFDAGGVVQSQAVGAWDAFTDGEAAAKPAQPSPFTAQAPTWDLFGPGEGAPQPRGTRRVAEPASGGPSGWDPFGWDLGNQASLQPHGGTWGPQSGAQPTLGASAWDPFGQGTGQGQAAQPRVATYPELGSQPLGALAPWDPFGAGATGGQQALPQQTQLCAGGSEWLARPLGGDADDPFVQGAAGHASGLSQPGVRKHADAWPGISNWDPFSQGPGRQPMRQAQGGWEPQLDACTPGGASVRPFAGEASAEQAALHPSPLGVGGSRLPPPGAGSGFDPFGPGAGGGQRAAWQPSQPGLRSGVQPAQTGVSGWGPFGTGK